MINKADDTTTLIDDRHDSRLPRARKLLPRPPRKVIVQTVGNGVRVTVNDYGEESAENVGSPAIFYNVYWAETVDLTTTTGIAYGFARATLLAPPIPAPSGRGRSRRDSVGFFPDPKYTVGYFFVCGVDADGNRSEPTNPAFIGTGGGGVIPPDVEHFQASESGEPQNDSVISAVSYSFRIPVTSKSAPIDHIQFFYKNYPNLNQTSEGESIRVLVGSGGTQTGKIKLPLGRRIGSGSITIVGTAVTGAGTNFLTLAAAAGGDQLEVFGVLARIASVTDATHMTLSSAWTGTTVTGISEWQVIGSVTIYAVSESISGARRSDVESAPSATVDLDGDLSAPIAPSVSLVDLAGGIRVYVTPPAGTQIDSITVYKGKGSGLAFSACTPLFTWPQDKVNSSPFLVYDDLDFATYDKEQGTTFSYYAAAKNVRGAQGAASVRNEYTARLQSNQDIDPTLTGQAGLKNLLFNAMLTGTVGSVVDTDDGGYGAATPAAGAGQNSFMFTDASNKLGRPYGGNGGQVDGTGRWTGHTLWAGTKGGGAPTQASFQNGNEVKLPAPTAGNSVYVFQEIGSWDDGRPAFMKVKKNAVLAFSIFAKWSGSQPNGSLHFRVEQYNNNAFIAYSPRRVRNSGGSLVLVDSAGGSTNDYVVTGSQLTSSWQRFYAIFITDASLGTTKQLRFTIEHSDSTAGDVVVTQPMINEGEILGLWTADMGDPYVGTPGSGSPPGQVGDGDGRREGRILQP